MNTEDKTTLNIPPPAEATELTGISKFVNLRSIVILLAVLLVCGGVIYLIAGKQKSITPPSSDTLNSGNAETSKSSGLNLAISDDPDILEKELYDINIENLDSDLGGVEKELNKL